MQATRRVQIASSGGRARARTLSPERRREIASFARWNRRQRESGQLSDSEFIGKLVRQIRASDPDLSAFVKKASSMPFKFQERMYQILTPAEIETIGRAQEALCKPA
jgi:hypothetical protein